MFNIFGKNKPNVPSSAQDAEDIPRYPPFAKGLPVVEPARLLKDQDEIVRKMLYAIDLEPDEADRLLRPILDRYARFVHLLPASETHHHRGAGGLLRHGLEVALSAAQEAEKMIFATDRTPKQRRELAPRWRAAIGIAGLVHDLGKPVTDVAVVDEQGERAWSPFRETLYEWAERCGVTRYYLRWRTGRYRRHEGMATLLLDRVLTPEFLDWLAEPDPGVLQALLEGVQGVEGDHPIAVIVKACDRRSVEKDLKGHHAPLDFNIGVPVEHYLVLAMRQFIRDGIWRVNEPGGRIWVLDADAIALVWPQAAREIAERLIQDRVPGIPKDPDALADILLERGLAEPRADAGRSLRYWSIAPEALQKDYATVYLKVLKIVKPDLVLEGGMPPAAAIEIAPLETSAPAEKPAAAGRKDVPPVPDEPKQTVEASGPAAEPAAAAPREPAQPGQRAEADAPRAATSPIELTNEAGDLIRQLRRGLASGRLQWEKHCFRRGDHVLLAHPQAAQQVGLDPKKLIQTLAAQRWLEADPRYLGRWVREIEGVRGLCLVPGLTVHLDVQPLSRKESPPVSGPPSPRTAQAEQRPVAPARSSEQALSEMELARWLEDALSRRRIPDCREQDGCVRVSVEDAVAYMRQQGLAVSKMRVYKLLAMRSVSRLRQDGREMCLDLAE